LPGAMLGAKVGASMGASINETMQNHSDENLTVSIFELYNLN